MSKRSRFQKYGRQAIFTNGNMSSCRPLGNVIEKVVRTEQKIKTGLLVAFLLMFVTAVVPFQTASRARSLGDELRQSEARIYRLTDILLLATDAETGQRGFIITGQEKFLDPYHAALLQLRSARKELRQSFTDAASLQQIDVLDHMIDAKLGTMENTIELRRINGFQGAEAVVSSGQGKQYMDNIRATVGKLVGGENARKIQLQKDAEREATIAAYSGLAATILNMLLVAIALHFVFRLLREQQQASCILRKAGEDLNAGMAELERRNNEISVLGQMARALESAASIKESLEIIALYCAKLLPHTAGELLLFRNSRDALEKGAQWGDVQSSEDMIEPGECWALRRGQPHKVAHADDLCCSHYQHKKESFRPHLCVPLTAQGEVLGLICMEPRLSGNDGVPDFDTHDEKLVLALVEQVSLALLNTKLREVLKHQSIVDPLTGLFNRRYMDETLGRELSRAARKSMPLSCVMLDVDHFKTINDTYGHEAGDAVLHSIAQRLKANVREGDLVCRFGGEELVLIMPECDKQDALDRAEKIRVALNSFDVVHGDKHVGRISASFGVASFPQDGKDAPALLEAADKAMYNAKNNGRNRVEMAA